MAILSDLIGQDSHCIRTLVPFDQSLLRFNLQGSVSSTQPVPVFVEQPERDARRGGGGRGGALPLGRRENLLDRHIVPLLPPVPPLVLLVVAAAKVVTHPQRFPFPPRGGGRGSLL